MLSPDTLTHLWLHLGWPLLRLLVFLSLGLLVALFIESLNWTRKLAVVARPLTSFGHLSPITGAARPRRRRRASSSPAARPGGPIPGATARTNLSPRPDRSAIPHAHR